ncbi:hypothetical protein F1880_000969 [Penicillium rolfsii]|nr:hypothetical protein F1880_000969 [Penicillium rolfsii]
MLPNQLQDLRKILRELMSHIDDLDRQTSNTGLDQHPSEPSTATKTSTPSGLRVGYRCRICSVGFGSLERSDFKRHLMSQHFLSRLYRCPVIGCNVVYHGRDTFINHSRFKHKQNLVQEEADAAAGLQRCPAICSVCARMVGDWDDFYECFTEHCYVPPDDGGLRDREHRPQQVTFPASDESQPPGARIATKNLGLDKHWFMDRLRNKFPEIEDADFLEMPLGIQQGQKRKQSTSKDEAPSSSSQSKQILKTSAEEHQKLALDTTPLVHLGKDESSQLPTRPIPNQLDSNNSKSSQPSDDEESDSIQTSITQPDQENEIDLDTGFADSEDVEHILHPGAYYRKLDALEQRTADICGIKGPEVQKKYIAELGDSLQKSSKALRNLMAEGFCDGTMSILVRDNSRPNVANAVRISLDEIENALDRLSMFTSSNENADITSLSDWPLLHSLLGVPRGRSAPETGWGELEYLNFVTDALSLGLVSFSGSHVCRFDMNLWGEERKGIALGNGYSFALHNLACLKDFVGGPAWILGKDQDVSDGVGLKVSLTVKDLQELWGPVWLMGGVSDEGVFIRTEEGYIVPLPRRKQTDKSLAEIECHWSRSYTGYETANPILLRSSSRILIGTGPSTTTGLSVNEQCRAQIRYLQARSLPQLQPCGAHKAYHTLAGWDFSMQATMGNSVQTGGTIKVKRNPVRTWKTSIIESCKYGKPHLRSLLSSNIGLEVSACTGNARRVTLWDVLRLSRTPAKRHSGISPHQESPTCHHRIADPKCIQFCWTRLFSTDDIDTPVNIPPEGHEKRIEYLRRIILNSIIALEDTGVDYNDNLQAYWPFTGSPRTHRIELSPSSSSGESNNWIRVIKDARDVATFAVVSQRCMEEHHGHVRTCTMPCQVAHLNHSKTPLYTRILLDGNDGNKLCPNEHFILGEAALTVQRVAPGDENVFIAGASGSALRNEWPRLIRLGKRKEFQEDLDCDLSTGYYLPLLVQ